jgi:hypothetical protein
MNNTNRQLLIQPPTEKWFLFTKNLAFKRILKDEIVVYLTLNATGKRS